MRLVRVLGNVRMQQALSHSYVVTIVDILLQHRETLGSVAEILQRFIQPREPGLTQALASIRILYSQLDAEENTIIPNHITTLTDTLDKMYHQSVERIQDQRGAIVELFARKLVCSRYGNDQDCSNSRKFVDDHGQPITIQEVDVAALSNERRHVEGYECKLKASGLEQHDCIDLAYLLEKAQESGYRANAGIVSFDPDRAVKRRLNHIQDTIQHLPLSRNIKVYGLESIESLQRTPFY